MCSLGVCFSLNAYAEGLPANPWAQQKNISVGSANQTKAEDLGSQTVNAAVDMWSKVRNSKEFRQWKMPEKESSNNNSRQNQNAEDESRKNLLTMLANLNRVGYQMPSNYRNVIGKSPTKSDNSSYERMIKQWQMKYQNTKNNTMNIVGRSYNNMLLSIKRSTGVDVNRTINETVNAFK